MRRSFTTGAVALAVMAAACTDGPLVGPRDSHRDLTPQLSSTAGLECDVVDFNTFSHGDAITSVSLFGGEVSLGVTATRTDPDAAADATAYDTELWDLDAGGLPPPPNDSHWDTQRYILCNSANNGGKGTCDGIMAVVPAPDFATSGDHPNGGSITLSGFPAGYTWTVPSYTVTDDDGSGQTISLYLDGVWTAQSSGIGNASVETVTTGDGTVTSAAEFVFEGSGGIDNIEICREGVCNAAIGDFVWSDENGNGIQDAGEPGIPGVTVNLLMGGDVVATTTTDANGFYLFSGLCPGTYEVEFVAPENFEFTNPDVGGDDTVDSDADPVTGRTGPIDLDDGETDLTWDAGFAPCAPCKGGVTSVTLKLLTGGTPFFDVGSDATVEDLGDDTYRISGPIKGDGTLDKLSDFEMFVNGEPDSKIHTSCSQPVDPGLIYGSFLIVASSSKDNGPICPLGDCSSELLEQKLDGNKFEWKIENTGISSLVIKSIDVSWPSAFGNLKKIELNGTIYEGPTAGPSLSLMEGDFLGIPKNRWIKPGDDDVLKFEWQDDISSSAEFSITVMFYGSDNETCILEFTGDEEPGDGGLSCADGKPQVLVMEYTGVNCTGPSCNDQDPGKVTVIGSPTGTVPNIWYKAGKKENPSDGDANRWGMGQVADGTLSIDATEGGDSKLASDTWVHLYSDASFTTVFQSIRFHTSCSQPLAVGDQFGSLLLAEYYPEP